MSQSQGPQIHPTAVVSAEAELADSVVVGAYAVIEGKVRIGPNCVIRPHAVLSGPLTMGQGNMVFSGAVLGERPQHLKYNGEPTSLEIGEHNVFREHASIHRGTTYSMVTRIGSHNYFMGNSHVGHDCLVGDRCILANGALVAGHCILEDSVYLSGNCAVHQFARVGRLALLSGCSATSKDIPPFIIQQGINIVAGINVVGMRRAGLKNDQINAVREAYRLLFRSGLALPAALARMEADMGRLDVIQEMIAFLRRCPKGINTVRGRQDDVAA
jgi:UDP-N-acetylglucosamine acyltransferase